MKQKNRLASWLSVQMATNPRRVILTCIVLFNVVFFIVASVVISSLAPASLAEKGFWASAFYTVSMILDAGCIEYVVEDVGTAGVAVIIACLIVVLIGMVTFTGCVIGYITNAMSGLIENAGEGNRGLYVSGHTVIINWNSRGAEIVNDLLYCDTKEVVVVLVPEDKSRVEAEIDNRLADTVAKEGMKNNLTVIVREGDAFSEKQLSDISLKDAKTVIILDSENDHSEASVKGNTTTLKELVLVAEITGSEDSADDQKIIIEVEDQWTYSLVNKIIRHKEKLGKSNMIAVPVDRILGQMLSQFSIMPELNRVYSELFSNQGAEVYAIAEKDAEVHDLTEYLSDHFFAVPLTSMETKTGDYYYYMADKEADPEKKSSPEEANLTLACNTKYWIPRRNILILGHNSDVKAIMNGFQSFRNEWNPDPDKRDFLGIDGRDILNIHVVDDEKSLERMNYYHEYHYVKVHSAAEVYDEKAVKKAINSFIDEEEGDTSILILSDDKAPADAMDVEALTYLIYVEEVLDERRAQNDGKDTEKIDVIVEIHDPKNYDVVHSYSVEDVVISSRFISRLLNQIGDKQPLFEFYSDILTYDAADRTDYTSKEMYVKTVREFLDGVDDGWSLECSASSLIRAVYEASLKLSEELGENRVSMVLGIVNNENGKMTFFTGDQRSIKLTVKPDDRLIMLSSH